VQAGRNHPPVKIFPLPPLLPLLPLLSALVENFCRTGLGRHSSPTGTKRVSVSDSGRSVSEQAARSPERVWGYRGSLWVGGRPPKPGFSNERPNDYFSLKSVRFYLGKSFQPTAIGNCHCQDPMVQYIKKCLVFSFKLSFPNGASQALLS
jgi:hypothetical protein